MIHKPSKAAPEQTDDGSAHLERLQKVLAAAGLGSRRACEEYIVSGRVTVDGQTVRELGAKVDPRRQDIRVDEERIRPERKQFFLLNKPKGVLSTNHDPSGRPRVIDLFPPKTRLFTVGRLDENTEGLMIVTNDGELANRLAHPRYQVPRTYKALVAGVPTAESLEQLRQGFYFTEGKFRVQRVRLVKAGKDSAILELILAEGQNREVRRLLARIGHKVMQLKRVAFGPLKLGDLKPGEYRPLNGEEIRRLRNFNPAAVRSRPAAGKRPPKRTTHRPRRK